MNFSGSIDTAGQRGLFFQRKPMLTVKEQFRDLYASVFSLRFADKVLDREYVLYNNEGATKMATAGLSLGIVAFLGLQVINYILYPDIYQQSYKMMFLFIIPMHFLIAVIMFHLGAVYMLQWLMMLANIFSGTCISVYFAHLPHDYTLQFGYATILVVNLYSFAMLRMRFFLRFFPALLWSYNTF